MKGASMDFSECKVCHEKLAASLWMLVFNSFSEAESHASGPEFLSFLGGPGFLKIDICYGCGTMKPTTEMAPKELEELKEYVQKRQERAASIGKIFGAIGKKP